MVQDSFGKGMEITSNATDERGERETKRKKHNYLNCHEGPSNL